jgi:uncharacterized membrane protein
MKVQGVFYAVGIIFIFATVGYFVYQFLDNIPDEIKFILLVFVTVVSFVVAELLRSFDK